MKVFILWGSVHKFGIEVFCGVYRDKEECLKKLKHEQEQISVDITEFHIQETELK